MNDSKAGVHVVIGVSPNSSLSLDNELRLLKPALLYADRVTLCSPTTSMIALTAGLGELSDSDRVEFLRQVVPGIGGQDPQIQAALDLYDALRRKRRRTRDEIIAVERVRRQIESAWADLRTRLEEITASSGADELVPAIDSGLLEVDLLLADDGDFDVDQMLRQFLERLADALSGGSSYPLFDDAAGTLVEAHLAEGLIRTQQSSVSRGRQVAAAASFMDRLPAFPQASVTEILDIRDEVRRPLVGFRSGMVEIARTISAASFEEGFSGEVEQVYVERIAPALQDINDAVRANAYLRRLLEASMTDMKTLATAVLTLGVARTIDMTPLIAGGAAAATAAATAAWKRAAARKKIRSHQLYFLYETQQLLTTG